MNETNQNDWKSNCWSLSVLGTVITGAENFHGSMNLTFVLKCRQNFPYTIDLSKTWTSVWNLQVQVFLQCIIKLVNTANSERLIIFDFEPKIMPIISRVISTIPPLNLKYPKLHSNNEFWDAETNLRIYSYYDFHPKMLNWGWNRKSKKSRNSS